jgi:hypothetical protein
MPQSRCPVCRRSFDTRSAYRQHKRAKEGQEHTRIVHEKISIPTPNAAVVDEARRPLLETVYLLLTETP